MCQQSNFYYTCNHVKMPPLIRCSRPNACPPGAQNATYGPTFDFPCPDCEEKAAAAERRDLGLMFGGGGRRAAGYQNTGKGVDLGGDAWTVVDGSDEDDDDDDDFGSLRGYRTRSPVMGKGKKRVEKDPERHRERSRRRVIVEDSEDEPWLQTVEKPVMKEDVKMKGALVVRPKMNGASMGAQDAVSRFEEEEEIRRREQLRGQSMGRDAVMGGIHVPTSGNFAGGGIQQQQQHAPAPRPRMEEKREPPVHHHPVKQYPHPPPFHIPSSSPSPLSPVIPPTRRPTPPTDTFSLTCSYPQPSSSSHRPATPSPCPTCRYQVLRYSCNHDTTFRPQTCGKDCKNVIQSPDLEVSMACPSCARAADNTTSPRWSQTQHHQQHPFHHQPHHQSHRAAAAHHTIHTEHKRSPQRAYTTPSYLSASCPHSACYNSDDDDYDYDFSCSSEEEIIIPAVPSFSAAARSYFILPSTSSSCHASSASSATYCAFPTPHFVPTVTPCFVPTAARPVELQLAESIVFARADRRGGGGKGFIGLCRGEGGLSGGLWC
ncbi:hypothetical protein EX30DRAFT_78341 [Ascodesmis nigricans]|uniref:Uncharacterized protein n=1 Tax=Ascodesmis nigricans TaxID=341454 RepID=A0A4S2MQP9_9PEZI|nr:hypothetical protein EX30DRAFT_78341 [Ascodesmis nigricans]